MLVLIGKTAAGKDTIKKELVKLGMQDIVTCTTRPMRNGEIPDVSYHFLSQNEFFDKKKEGYFAEYTKYHVATGQTWYYGTPKNEISDSKVIIMNPEGLKKLLKQKELHIVSFYIQVPEDVLLERLQCRGDNPEEYKRRLMADKRDFLGIESIVDCVVDNNAEKSPDEIAKFIKNTYDFLTQSFHSY